MNSLTLLGNFYLVIISKTMSVFLSSLVLYFQYNLRRRLCHLSIQQNAFCS